MSNESDFEEDFSLDFSEIPLFTGDEPTVPKQIKTSENNSFEILTVEKIVENVYDMVGKVQSVLTVRVFNSNLIEIIIFFGFSSEKDEREKEK